MNFFREFNDRGALSEVSLNTSFLVLIPKNGGAEDLNDFCINGWQRSWQTESKECFPR